MIKNNNYKKFTAQINIDQKFGNKATLGITLHANRTNMDNVPLQDGFAEASDLLRTAYQFPPNLEVKDNNGTYTINQYASFLSNPVSILEMSNKTKNDRIIGNIYFSYNLLTGLENQRRHGYIHKPGIFIYSHYNNRRGKDPWPCRQGCRRKE